MNKGGGRIAFEPARHGAGKYLPILGWAGRYNREWFADDALAAVIVTIMLIPQSLAYAMLAGLPPEVGVYASIAPLVAYAIFGTSATLAVGPVAVVSLMTAAAISRIIEPGGADYASAALALSALTGVMLLGFGLLRLGFIANFLSHPIISSFISASAILIAASQLGAVLGVKLEGHTFVETIVSLASAAPEANLPTFTIGASVMILLWATRTFLEKFLVGAGIRKRPASIVVRAAPLAAIILSIVAVDALGLDAKGVAIVGATPAGLPPFAAPPLDFDLWSSLAGSAALIAIIGYVESVSVAHTLAAKRRERIDQDQELIALGASNLAASFTGGYPVTGGFARSVVNFDAGARTPAAGAFTAVGIALAALFLTPLLFNLPKATLAATIIVAVLSLVDLKAFRRTFIYSRSDFAAMSATFVGVLTLGVEAGLVAGVILSILLLLYRTSMPHMAIVGQVPGTEHFRNIDRHKVVTSPRVAALRIDGDLFFANARFVEKRILSMVDCTPPPRHIVLMCSAINSIDMSALEMLEGVATRLADAGVTLHFTELKGPVTDKLSKTDFLDHLGGQVFLTQFQAMHALDPETFLIIPAERAHPEVV